MTTAVSRADFDSIVREQAAFVWRVLFRYGVARSQLEDVSQDVFLALHRSLPQFEGRSSLRTFVYGICRHLAANHRKRAVHRREVVHADVPELAPDTRCDAFEIVADRQALAAVQECVARLSPERRDVFLLYEVDELTMREIAEALNCPQGTCFSRLYAARKLIAAELAPLRAKQSVA